MKNIETQLQDLGFTLPTPAAPVALYVPYTIINNLVFIAGQLPMQNGSLAFTGKVTVEQIPTAQQAAQLCALNLLAQLKAAVAGDWNRIQGCVRLNGFVQCGADFYDHAKVMNGASELITKVMGENARHTRVAVGACSLPLNAMVEIDAIFSLVH